MTKRGWAAFVVTCAVMWSVGVLSLVAATSPEGSGAFLAVFYSAMAILAAFEISFLAWLLFAAARWLKPKGVA